MKAKVFGIILASAVITTACKTTAVAEAPRTSIKVVIHSPDVTLVDVRIPGQYEEETAKNAVNIPLAEIEKNIDFFKKQKNVVVFCNKGIQADKAVEILKKNGVENVYDGTSLRNVQAIQEEKSVTR